MIRIEINAKDSAVEARTVIRKKDNKQIQVYEQRAYLFKDGDAYPEPIMLNVNSPSEGYSPGLYHFADESFRVSRFKKPELDPYNTKLVPVAK